jgi:hypothetical protein
MNRIIVAKELLKLAKELLAEQWVQVPGELLERSDLSGVKLKVTGDSIKAVTERDDKPAVGSSFSLQEEGNWLKGLSKLLGLSPAKHESLEKWIRGEFPHMKTASKHEKF